MEPITKPRAGGTTTPVASRPPEDDLAPSDKHSSSPAKPSNAGTAAPPLPPGIAPAALSPLTQSFESSNNLAQLVRDLTARANAGDAQAARAVEQALDECAPLSLMPNLGQSFYTDEGRIPESRRGAALAHLARYRERCTELAGAEKITSQRLLDARQAASHGSDLVEQGRRLVESHSAMSAAEVKSTLRRIVESRDGEAIASISNAMAESQDERELFGPRSGSNMHAMAWKLVACDLGMPCGPTSALARQACLFHGACIQGDFREIVRFFHLSPWQYELALKEEREILRDIASGNFNEIFP